MQAVFNYINSRNYREALNLLDRMPNRNAMWYYASGFANAGIGNNVLAREHAHRQSIWNRIMYSIVSC